MLVFSLSFGSLTTFVVLGSPDSENRIDHFLALFL